MREVAFALTFEGRAGPVPGTARRRARTSAAGQTLRATFTAAGVTASVRAVRGARARFDSEVESVGDGTFAEWGRIRYGRAGSVTFTTVGRGVLVPDPDAGGRRGAVMWTVTGGDGRFAGARGLITSNFVVDGSGRVVDCQFARLLLPDAPPASRSRRRSESRPTASRRRAARTSRGA